MHRRYQDAMAIVRAHGRPDLFITVTCNPEWPDIRSALLPGQQPQDRPDIVARVFKGHLDAIVKDIKKNSIFGQVAAFMSVIEFQKRGLPHAHILVILAPEDRLRSADVIDSAVCAEIPENEELCALVCRFVLHNECGPHFPNARCMKDGRCGKHFPMSFAEYTSWNETETHPTYRRRSPDQGGIAVTYRGRHVDNRWVVPYNPFLLFKYKCHINVEACSSVKACKYLYKYVYKGHDRAMLRTENVAHVDEIHEYQDMRCIGSSEACWRLYDFEVSERVPSVMALPVHLPHEQRVYFRDGEQDLAAQRAPPATNLTAWFDYNARHQNDGTVHHLYCDFPRHLTFNKREKMWNPRTRYGRFPTIGRVNIVHPSAGDVFYLRLLLHNEHAKGKRDFVDLRTVNGVVAPTYQEACRQLGLLQDDTEWDHVLTDAALTHMPPQMRDLFVMLLEFCNPADPTMLFESHWADMGDEYVRSAQGQCLPWDVLRTMVLIDIERRLLARGKSLRDSMLPPVDVELRRRVAAVNQSLRLAQLPRLLQEELAYDQEEQRAIAQERLGRLQPSQQEVVLPVLDAVAQGQPSLAFVDAPGGTGKTFCFNTVVAAVRAQRRVALGVASSGIAATLMPGARTFHSRFRAPLQPTDTSTCNIPVQSDLARLIREAAIIVWDEAPMAHRFLLEALDRTLRDVTGAEDPFGGKVLLLGGDFRQVLPVVKRGSRAQIVAACLKRSPLWPHFRIFHLRENMRIRSSTDEAAAYADWVLRLGNGQLPTTEDDMVDLPANLCLPHDTGDLIEWTFPDLANNCHDPNWMFDRAILAPHNSVVDSINAAVISRFPGQEQHCISADGIVDDEDQVMAVPTEYLNSINTPELPPHDLCLKPGMPVILLRNLNPQDSLCNGTRLLVTRVLAGRLLEARNNMTGRTVLIPRIPLRPTDDTFPFRWQRRQFPIRPAFAMTINKAQGQTLGRVGVQLGRPVFTHGQLYVAASRVSDPSNIRFGVDLQTGCRTKNVVYTEALS
jgi:hypothetical protein